jgi:uncharacterized protein (DUF983 family)
VISLVKNKTTNRDIETSCPKCKKGYLKCIEKKDKMITKCTSCNYKEIYDFSGWFEL